MITNNTQHVMKLDGQGVFYRDLNTRLHEAVSRGIKQIELRNIYGQRYIGTNLDKPVEIKVYGIPGNDMGAFMNGPKITVYGNAQDGCGNTMNSGEIIVHGNAGDIIGLSARGGKIFVRGNVGYRAGIHMKEYQGKMPILIIGGTAQDFIGEYMAGGILILLGLNLKEGERHQANFIGTGMHGGVIYIRGSIEDYQIGKEVGITEPNDTDYDNLIKHLSEFATNFDFKISNLLNKGFTKLYPRWTRPYGRLYSY